MENEKGNKPNYRGQIDIAGWSKMDKNGKKFISLKISQYCDLFEIVVPESSTKTEKDIPEAKE